MAKAGNRRPTFTTQDLKRILGGGEVSKIVLSEDTVKKLVKGRLAKREPDLQWLYDTAMEPGNSEGNITETLDGGLVLEFNQCGCCTLGIVCNVVFYVGDLTFRKQPDLFNRITGGKSVYPEHVEGLVPARVELSYDASYDEEEDEEDEE